MFFGFRLSFCVYGVGVDRFWFGDLDYVLEGILKYRRLGLFIFVFRFRSFVRVEVLVENSIFNKFFGDVVVGGLGVRF